jgi:hypothetical protein
MSDLPANQQALELALREIEAHVAGSGWDQPTRLYALVLTQQLLASEPSLADEVSEGEEAPLLTSVEQADLPEHEDLTDLLARLSWPDGVLGLAVVAERIMLPADAEAELPTDREEARQAVMRDPRRHEMRLAAASLRDGSRYCLLRLREHDSNDSVLSGPDLITDLADLLHESLTS